MLSKLKSFVSKTYVFIILATALAFGGGFGTATHQYKVTPEKIVACNSDPYLQILGQVVYFKWLGATKDDLLAQLKQADIPAEVRPLAEKAINEVYDSGTDDLSLIGSKAYAECLNRK